MNVIASPQVAAFVRRRGGRVFVWGTAHGCCGGGIRSLVTRTEPDPTRSFTRYPGDGFDVWFDPGPSPIPNELVLELKGRRRPRVEAYWDGCAFVV